MSNKIGDRHSEINTSIKNNIFASKNFKLFLQFLLIASIFTFIIHIGVNSLTNSNEEASSRTIPIEEVDYDATVCIYSDGEFEGRKTPAHQGILEEVDCDHNVFYTSGIIALKNQLGGLGGTLNVTTIALDNATAGGGEPVEAGTEAYSELSACGFSITNGTYTSFANGNWTITNTFTSSCTSTVFINVSRLLATNGTKFSGSSFTGVNLSNSDQLTINWSLGVQ